LHKDIYFKSPLQNNWVLLTGEWIKIFQPLYDKHKSLAAGSQLAWSTRAQRSLQAVGEVSFKAQESNFFSAPTGVCKAK
jgi:hypothetical protein